MKSDSSGMNVVPIDTSKQAPSHMRLKSLPQVVSHIHSHSKLLLLNRLKTFFDKADDALFDLADKASSNQEQNVFFDSMREVRIQRRNIEARFGVVIDNAFANIAAAETSPVSITGSFEAVRADALSLVDNADLEEMVAVDTAVARANSDFAEPLQYLSLRLDSLVPIKIYQKNNPLGPDVLCSAFMALLKPLDITIPAKLVLFRLFDKNVIGYLGDVYSAINQVLVDHNVMPSLPSVSGDSERSQNRLVRSPSSHISVDVLNALNEMFGDAARENAPQHSDRENKELLSMLSAAQQSSKAEITSADLRSLVSALRKRKGIESKAGFADDEVINLVAMLFEFILNDRNLAPEMKALIGRMQIPILKVAISDKAFFTTGGHIARRLLNEMATAALGWIGDDTSTSKDPLYKKMEFLVERLLAEFTNDISIFSELLTDFTAFLEKERKRAAILERRTLDAEDGKAKAELARQKVDDEIHLRLVNCRLPPVVERLLNEAWRNVMFVNGLKFGYESDEWKQSLRTMDELTWSVRIPANDRQRQTLIRLVPVLVKKLRAGLDTVSYNPFEMQKMLKALEAIHLKCIRAKPAPDAEAKKQLADKLAVANTVKSQVQVAAEVNADAAVDEQPSAPITTEDRIADVVSESELKTEALDLTVTEQSADASADARAGRVSSRIANPDEHESAAEPDAGYLAQVRGFSQGTWFDMESEGQLVRCRLAAIIKSLGRYIFVNRSGMKVAEKTEHELAQALQTSDLRMLDNSVLFDRALETVVSGLRKKN